jgi:four helix bundle protein
MDNEAAGKEHDKGRGAAEGRRGLEVGGNIAERLIGLGVAVLRVSSPMLRKNPGSRHVALELIRAATGAGANYEEARAAESRADFAHKVGLAAKEMREACYWLGLVHRCGWFEEDLSRVVREANELAAILGASARTARARATPNSTET